MKMKKILVAVMTLAMSLTAATTAFAATPVYQNGFDGSLGGAQTAVRVGDVDGLPPAPVLPTVDESITAQFDAGKNGQALYLDSSYGVILDAAAVGDTYTVAFWVNPARFSNFGPILQIGSDLLSANASAAWLNITKTDWDGDMAPVVWSRNEATTAWPWYAGGSGYIIPKNEWTHIAVTVDGTAVGTSDIMAVSQLYINGELLSSGDIATGTFTGDAKVYLGINCWDALFKGLFDDVKIYNTVLTADEVKTAMNEPAAAAEATETATTDVPKTGVESFALIFGLGAAVLGTGSLVLKKKK